MAQILKLYLISQEENCTYDTYDAVVVAAYDEADARSYNPDIGGWGSKYSSWCSSLSSVKIQYLGKAAAGITAGEILASFNAG